MINNPNENPQIIAVKAAIIDAERKKEYHRRAIIALDADIEGMKQLIVKLRTTPITVGS